MRRAVEAGVRLAGGIFDIDGVLLDTPHERAWREALDALMAGVWRDLASRIGYRPGALTREVSELRSRHYDRFNLPHLVDNCGQV